MSECICTAVSPDRRVVLEIDELNGKVDELLNEMTVTMHTTSDILEIISGRVAVDEKSPPSGPDVGSSTVSRLVSLNYAVKKIRERRDEAQDLLTAIKFQLSESKGDEIK